MNKLIYNNKFWINQCNPEILKKNLSILLTESGYTIIEFIDYNFNPQGYTCIWLLSESHLAVHTFPEHNTSYIELSGCNKKMNKNFINKINCTFINKNKT